MDNIELKALLKSAKMTYQELSGKSGVPIDTIKKFMSGSTKKLRKQNELAITQILNQINVTPLVNNYVSNEEEEILDMYRKLSKENKSVILKNFYILLNPDERSDYQILKNIK